nr:uncharacterized protein LOC123289421 [Equus asinus]
MVPAWCPGLGRDPHEESQGPPTTRSSFLAEENFSASHRNGKDGLAARIIAKWYKDVQWPLRTHGEDTMAAVAELSAALSPLPPEMPAAPAGYRPSQHSVEPASLPVQFRGPRQLPLRG